MTFAFQSLDWIYIVFAYIILLFSFKNSIWCTTNSNSQWFHNAWLCLRLSIFHLFSVFISCIRAARHIFRNIMTSSVCFKKKVITFWGIEYQFFISPLLSCSVHHIWNLKWFLCSLSWTFPICSFSLPNFQGTQDACMGAFKRAGEWLNEAAVGCVLCVCMHCTHCALCTLNRMERSHNIVKFKHFAFVWCMFGLAEWNFQNRFAIFPYSCTGRRHCLKFSYVQYSFSVCSRVNCDQYAIIWKM